jgi:hypothetical protein
MFMDDQRFKRLTAAADFFNSSFRPLVTTERGIHAETIVASAARMAGTMLFRSFIPAPNSYEPGTVVLSDAANVEGPKLMNVMFATLKQLGDAVGEDTINRDAATTEASQLTLRQTQERFDPVVIAYCKAARLSFEDAALSLAITAAIFVHDCCSALDVRNGAAIAVYGFIEGCKTAPIRLTAVP